MKEELKETAVVESKYIRIKDMIFSLEGVRRVFVEARYNNYDVIFEYKDRPDINYVAMSDPTGLEAKELIKTIEEKLNER